MVWPDMLPLWIITYDLWNFTYMYNCIGLRSFYVLGILIACTYADFAFRRGAWIQHRVFTLAFNLEFFIAGPVVRKINNKMI